RPRSGSSPRATSCATWRASSRAAAVERLLQALEQRDLTADDLLPRGLQPEPRDAVDLREPLPPSRARRPLQLERPGRDLRRVEVALDGERDDALAAALADLAERHDLAVGRRVAELLGELAARARERVP